MHKEVYMLYKANLKYSILLYRKIHVEVFHVNTLSSSNDTIAANTN